MLEIRVSDQIQLFDTLKKATEYILDEIRRWYVSDDKAPLTIELVKRESRGSPTLSVSVTEEIITKSTFG